MFKKDQIEHSKQNKEAETIIGPSVKVKGNFHGQGNMIIEGMVEGSIKTDSNLYVGDNAKITANIKAKEARIGGEIKGNITVKGYLEVAGSAIINGDIEASSLSISKGAIFNGHSTMGQETKNKEHKKD
jgi:cytoskeletal protein CcmA (bactofilin family)